MDPHTDPDADISSRNLANASDSGSHSVTDAHPVTDTSNSGSHPITDAYPVTDARTVTKPHDIFDNHRNNHTVNHAVNHLLAHPIPVGNKCGIIDIHIVTDVHANSQPNTITPIDTTANFDTDGPVDSHADTECHDVHVHADVRIVTDVHVNTHAHPIADACDIPDIHFDAECHTNDACGYNSGSNGDRDVDCPNHSGDTLPNDLADRRANHTISDSLADGHAIPTSLAHRHAGDAAGNGNPHGIAELDPAARAIANRARQHNADRDGDRFTHIVGHGGGLAHARDRDRTADPQAHRPTTGGEARAGQTVIPRQRADHLLICKSSARLPSYPRVGHRYTDRGTMLSIACRK